jgi:hypothetical protein
MFRDLGENLGGISHIISFWNFRFPKGRSQRTSSSELLDIFSDFEASLAFSANPARAPSVLALAS